MIKTVIFDLGKVLVPFDFNRGYRAIEELSGLQTAEIRARIGGTDLVPRFETGLLEAEDFVGQLCALLGLRISYQQFCELWSSVFLKDTLVPESLLAALRERYRLILLSNTNSIHFEMIRANYPLLRHFHDYILSYRVGAMKPSPAIYRAAIASAGCLPEECFFTDDIPDFVEGAKKEGIDAVQFHSGEQIEGELRGRGVIW